MLPPPRKQAGSRALREGVDVTNLSFDYSGKIALFQGLSFGVRPSESVGLMGPSGCGKSTLLRLLAGLLQPQTGSVRVDGDPPATAARSGSVSFAFQQPALLPWRTCSDNIMLPLTLLARTGQDRLVQSLLSSFGLCGSEHKFPHELSGGLAQRASVARALVVEPQLLLLDEPLSSVDWPLRRSVLAFIRGFCSSRGVTTIVVSHDSRELVYLCNRVLVFGGDASQGYREFSVPECGDSSADTFNSPGFFRTTLALDDFAYPSTVPAPLG